MALPVLLGQVHAHIQEVRNDPSRGLNVKLLENIDTLVAESIEESWRDSLLNQLSDLLPTLQQDPTPVTNLIIVLVSPKEYDFTRVLTIQPPVDFISGFSSSLPSINLTALTLLSKATYRKSDIDLVAGTADVIAALIILWLRTPETAVAVLAHNVILGLLLPGEGMSTMTDSGIMGEGLMWRRILRDRDIYGSIFSICSLDTADQEWPMSKAEKTLSQGRLLDMLLKIDSNPIRTSQIPEIEQRFGVKDGGLLQFAAIHMVDYQDDVLMHMTLIDFYAKYLVTGPTFALHFLRSNGLHNRSMAYYLEPEKQDSLELAYLYSSSARYLSIYCTTYPRDLLSSPIAGQILSRVTQATENRYSQIGPKNDDDLYVLISLPRVMLIPRSQGSSPLFLIPVKAANPNAFEALAHILNGSCGCMPEEQAAARALYYLEMEKHPDFWECVVTAADTVALKESAMSAIELIGAVITATWSPLPDTDSATSFRLPSEGELAAQCHAESLPQSGIEAIMTQPAREIVIPYLMRPARSFGSLASGGRGDVESPVYQIASAKHEVLKLLHQRLAQWVETRGEGQDMVAAIGRRVAQGPMGGMSEVGAQVGTIGS